MTPKVRVAILACCVLSACATRPRPEASEGGEAREAQSANTAEVLRDCIVAGFAETPVAGLPAPVAETSADVNGFMIAFPPLPHTGVVVSRRDDATSKASWHSVEEGYLAPIAEVIRGCAAS